MCVCACVCVCVCAFGFASLALFLPLLHSGAFVFRTLTNETLLAAVYTERKREKEKERKREREIGLFLHQLTLFLFPLSVSLSPFPSSLLTPYFITHLTALTAIESGNCERETHREKKGNRNTLPACIIASVVSFPPRHSHTHTHTQHTWAVALLAATSLSLFPPLSRTALCGRASRLYVFSERKRRSARRNRTERASVACGAMWQHWQPEPTAAHTHTHTHTHAQIHMLSHPTCRCHAPLPSHPRCQLRQHELRHGRARGCARGQLARHSPGTRQRAHAVARCQPHKCSTLALSGLLTSLCFSLSGEQRRRAVLCWQGPGQLQPAGVCPR